MISATTRNFSFSKTNCQGKPEMFFITKRLIAIIWTRPEPENYLSYEARTRGDLSKKVFRKNPIPSVRADSASRL
jgi:hypothetical protein